MLKWLVITAIGLTLGVHLTPRAEAQERPKKAAQNAAPKPSPSPPVTCVNNQWTTTETQPSQNQPPSGNKAPEWALVIVGVITFGVIGWQAKLTKDSVATMERQIASAEADTQAMIRAERAWIVVSVKEIEPGVYVFSVKNEGKTPAKVDSVYCCNPWTPREAKLWIPPDDQTAKSQLQNPAFLLPPQAEKTIWRLERTTFEVASGGGPGEQSRFARGFGYAHTYGRIRYYDVLENPPMTVHETRFLYLLIPRPGSIPFPDPMHSKYNTYI